MSLHPRWPLLSWYNTQICLSILGVIIEVDIPMGAAVVILNLYQLVIVTSAKKSAGAEIDGDLGGVDVACGVPAVDHVIALASHEHVALVALEIIIAFVSPARELHDFIPSSSEII